MNGLELNGRLKGCLLAIMMAIGCIIGAAIALEMTEETSAETATSGTTGDCTWTLAGVTLTISGNGEMADYGYGSKPWGSNVRGVIIEEGVTSIGKYAFRDSSNLTTVVLPSSIITIGDSAFADCGKLTSMPIPASVTAIGTRAFQGCNALSITVDGSNGSFTSEGGALFTKDMSVLKAYPAASGSYTIPDSVTGIEASAFSGSEVTSVSGGGQLATIGPNSFTNCRQLSSIVLPQSLTAIDNAGFSHCTSLTDVVIPDSVTTIGQNVFLNCGLTSATLPKTMKEMPWGLFQSCKFTSFIIPDSVVIIRDGVFLNCKELESVTIPGSVKTIDHNPFQGCTNLTSIIVDESNGYFVSTGSALYSKDMTRLRAYPAAKGDHTIPDSVTIIGEYAFASCSELSSITIPDSVTQIGEYAFSRCSSLTSLSFPDSVTSIGSGISYFCDKLQHLRIPYDARIESNAFLFQALYDLDGVSPLSKDTESLAGWIFEGPGNSTLTKKCHVLRFESSPSSIEASYSYN